MPIKTKLDMKKLLYVIGALLVSNYALAQSTNKNYVKTTTYNQPVQNQLEIDALSDYNKDESIIYYDGLGRPEQKIIYRAGGESGVSQNNILINDWYVGDYSSSFYKFSGQAGENGIIEGTSPFGGIDALWECNNDAASNADGGWNTAYLGIDNTKTYRYTVWVKRTGNISNGRTYHGTKNVNNLDGTANSNPYFFSSYLPQANTWYLLVGIIHPHDFSGTTSTGVSGVYDMQGNKVLGGNEFKWSASTTVSYFRNYLYYCTDTSAKQYFWNPVLQEFNGEEFTLPEIQNTTQVLSNGHKDLVVPIKYDDFGRQVKDYLPVPISNAKGQFRPNDLVISDSESYYLSHFADDLSASSVNVFSQKSLESSPLNRLLEQAAPGESWKLNSLSDTDNTIKFDYQTNVTGEVSLFLVNFLQGNTASPQLVYDGSFAANQLYKTITKDENWKPSDINNHTTEEFKNKQGQVILKRTYNANSKHDTYYVYDDYGNLTYVLSPEGSETIENASNSISQLTLDKFCYQYKYDYRNRLINKKIPGKGWESIVYDSLDRPILTQDALQASKDNKEWLFTKYDAFSRVVYTGLYISKSSRDALQETVKNYTSNDPSLLFEERKASATSPDSSTELYYTNTAFPTVISSIYTINYYDDYAWDVDVVFNSPSYLGQTLASNTKTLATGSKVRVLETEKWITSVNYYDEKARSIYHTTSNSYLLTKEETGLLLDFSGKVLKTHHTHTRDNDAPIITVDEFTYDQAGRLLTQQQQINNFDKELLVKNSYDDLGQLVKKQVGGKIQESNSYNLVSNNLTVSGNSIVKNNTANSSWDAGLSTTQTISGDGYVSYTVPQTNKSMMVGLAYADTNLSYNHINYAIYHVNGSVRIYESGVSVPFTMPYLANDSFKVERRGQTIHYIKNGAVFYSSQVPTSAGPLLGDISMHTIGGRVDNLVIASLEDGLQDVDYDYNIRGWLKQINDVDNIADDLFSFKLNYNTIEGNAVVDPLYNGNISQTIWKTASTTSGQTNLKRGYSYNYDALNRINEGIFRTGDALTTTAKYGLSNVSYDKNGNILTLNRENNAQLMDQLSYIYDGNQLQQVNDGITTITDQGFVNGTNVGVDYSYDVNGNMTKDNNKSITSITYNHLNLPTNVEINGKGSISYVYDATGVKQMKTVSETIMPHASSATLTMYANNFIYKKFIPGYRSTIIPRWELKFFSHAEGYIEPTVNYPSTGGGKVILKQAGVSEIVTNPYLANADYVYQFKDHLGNIRLSYSDSDGNGDIDAGSEIIEENNYYPFGLKHKGYNNVINGTDHKYGFGGKEEQEELGLGWVDITARNYNPELGRWMNIDPLAEKMRRHSPYNYAFNNPVFFIDYDGMMPTDPIDPDEKIQHTGSGTVIGDNVENQLDEVCLNCDDTDGFSGYAKSLHGEFTEKEKRINGYKVYGEYNSGDTKTSGSLSGFSLGLENNTQDGVTQGGISANGIEAKLTTGNETLETEVTGSLFKVDASYATGTYKGENGSAGIVTRAKIGVYAAKVEATSSFTFPNWVPLIGGTKIGVTYGATFGSAHVGGELNLSNNGQGSVTAKGEVQFGFGLGTKLGFSISTQSSNTIRIKQ